LISFFLFDFRPRHFGWFHLYAIVDQIWLGSK
jgi:hypothetical protein